MLNTRNEIVFFDFPFHCHVCCLIGSIIDKLDIFSNPPFRSIHAHANEQYHCSWPFALNNWININTTMLRRCPVVTKCKHFTPASSVGSREQLGSLVEQKKKCNLTVDEIKGFRQSGYLPTSCPPTRSSLFANWAHWSELEKVNSSYNECFSSRGVPCSNVPTIEKARGKWIHAIDRGFIIASQLR